MTIETTTHEPAQRTGDWQAIHIFYASDPKPLLTECVAPLVAELREGNLLAGYFFINYWLEGPHVRLRLKPVSAAATDEVRRVAELRIGEFLARRPALYEVDSDFLVGFYDDMFRLEYSERERVERYGNDGPMPLRPNNSYHYIPYEPEYGKYGGPDGVRLAEWHFEHSSDLVLDLIEKANTHLRTVTLGLAAQLMMIMSTTFLRDRNSVAEFMERYHHFWHDWFQLGNSQRDAAYESNYTEIVGDLRHRFSEIFHSITSDKPDRLTSFGRAWALHCAELRARVSEYAEQGRLIFPARDESGEYRPGRTVTEREAVTDPEVALRALLSPYMHMTNNRLGANVVDESYLSYLLFRSLTDNTAAAGADETRAR
ncbi:MAG TPA: lantibiotic dehydratase C-terminal domain-containing protein [Streptosporangiaceae bacterium]|jgi:hypothetical protein